MILALSVTGISSILFILCGWVFSYEDRIGRRIFIVSIRTALDERLVRLRDYIQHHFVYVGRYVITLSWYYSLHAFLIVMLKTLAKIYFSVEKLLHHNRDKAKKIRSEKRRSLGIDTHLSQIAEYQIETALTESEKSKRRKRALEGK